MKTFNDSDLITWANREKANTYEKYYFADSISGMQKQINNDKSIHKLIEIDDNCVHHPFRADDYVRYACILPTDKVIEKEPEKKYRPLKSIRELYEVIFDLVENPETFKDTSDKYCTYGLIRDCVLHLKSKLNNCEYYTSISSIIKENGNVQICMSHTNYTNFSDLFEEFDIEINGEWQPFGVLDED